MLVYIVYVGLYWFTLVYIGLYWFMLVYIGLYWFMLVQCLMNINGIVPGNSRGRGRDGRCHAKRHQHNSDY
jgi:hypothetical protein